jgi:hypothetical protein
VRRLKLRLGEQVDRGASRYWSARRAAGLALWSCRPSGPTIEPAYGVSFSASLRTMLLGKYQRDPFDVVPNRTQHYVTRTLIGPKRSPES